MRIRKRRENFLGKIFAWVMRKMGKFRDEREKKREGRGKSRKM